MHLWKELQVESDIKQVHPAFFDSGKEKKKLTSVTWWFHITIVFHFPVHKISPYTFLKRTVPTINIHESNLKKEKWNLFNQKNINVLKKLNAKSASKRAQSHLLLQSVIHVKLLSHHTYVCLLLYIYINMRKRSLKKWDSWQVCFIFSYVNFRMKFYKIYVAQWSTFRMYKRDFSSIFDWMYVPLLKYEIHYFIEYLAISWKVIKSVKKLLVLV